MVKDKPSPQDKPPRIKRKLINRLSFVQKFGVICLLFALSMGTMTFVTVREETDAAATAYNALLGVRYVRPITTLIKYLTEHQQTSQRFLMGDTSLENVLAHEEQQISETFNELEENDRVIGPLLFSEKNFITEWHQSNWTPTKLKQEWGALQDSYKSLTPDANFQQHNQLITNLRTLSALAGDASTIVLTTESAGFYLSYIIFISMPELQQELMYVASTTERAAAKKALAPVDKTDLIGHIALTEHFLDHVTSSLWKAAQARKNTFDDLELKAALEEPMASLSTAITDFLAIVKRNILDGNTITIPAGTLMVSSTRALSETYQFSELGAEQLDRILLETYEMTKHQRLMTLVYSMTIALVAFISSFVLLRAMLSPLRKLVATANHLAKGNLGVRVDVTQHDEIAQVGMALNKMAISIEEVLENLQRAGVQLTTTTTEIAAAAKEQETTIVQQETATKEIAVTAKEISATASEFANYIHEVTHAAEETSTLAATGKEGLAKLKNIMKQLVDATTEIADKLSSLNEKTGVITGVITTITKVADRTNLLSLNAAIEAHKLGAKGGSFGVIATEIRRLADQTAFATLDIEKVVHQMVSAVSTSVEGVAKFSEDIRQGVKQANTISGLLTKIIAQVQQQTASFESVNQGMETQSAGAKQITDSIEELSEAAQQSTASIRQFHTALAHLSSAIKDLQSTVARLQHQPPSIPPLGSSSSFLSSTTPSETAVSHVI